MLFLFGNNSLNISYEGHRMNKTCHLSGYLLVFILTMFCSTSIVFAADTYAEQEQQMIDLINSERTDRGLEPLSVNPILTGVAREHSKDMIDNDYFSHDSLDGTLFSERIKDAGYTIYRIGENIAMNYPPDVVQAHENLMSSSGHRANILSSDYNEIGIGIWVGEYSSYSNTAMYTQDFGWNPDAETPEIALSIELFEPASSSVLSDSGDQLFSIQINNVCDVSWSVDGNVVKTEKDVTGSYYNIQSASGGEHNIEVTATGPSGTDSVSWKLEVGTSEAIKGDFDGDSDVDFDDFVEFAEVYESTSDDSNYSQIFDFDDDGNVDFDDFVEFAGVYKD